MDLLRKDRARTDFERFAAVHTDTLLRNAYLMAGDRGEAGDLERVVLCLVAGNARGHRYRSDDFHGNGGPPRVVG